MYVSVLMRVHVLKQGREKGCVGRGSSVAEWRAVSGNTHLHVHDHARTGICKCTSMRAQAAVHRHLRVHGHAPTEAAVHSPSTRPLCSAGPVLARVQVPMCLQPRAQAALPGKPLLQRMPLWEGGFMGRAQRAPLWRSLPPPLPPYPHHLKGLDT